jgi:DNA invertase Pin-like site-specific DNA recombinase
MYRKIRKDSLSEVQSSLKLISELLAQVIRIISPSTESRDEKIVKMHKANFKQKQIAYELNINRATVRRVLNNHGIGRKNKTSQKDLFEV